MRALEEAAASSECELFLALLEKKLEAPDERPYHRAWYYDKEEEDVSGGEDESVPVAEARVSMRSLVNLRDRELISEYTFGDESECAEVILQGGDAFDAVEPDVEDDYNGVLTPPTLSVILFSSYLALLLLFPAIFSFRSYGSQ